MHFVPLWTSILKSRKCGELPDDLFRTWVLCLLAAQDHDHRGGSLPSPDNLSYSLHLSTEEMVSRLSRLSRDGFIERRDGVYFIHDWEDWKHRPDPTAAERKRAQRAREKAEKETQRESSNGDAEKSGDHTEGSQVTDVTDVTRDISSHGCHALTLPNLDLNSPSPLPPSRGEEVGEGEGSSLSRWKMPVVGAYEDDEGDEPFVPPDVDQPPPSLPPDQQAVLDITAKWWADDSCVRRLLKVFDARVVRAATQEHFLRDHGRLHMGRLEGICRAMSAGRWMMPPDQPTLKFAPAARDSTPIPPYLDTSSEEYRKFLETYHVRKAT